LVAAITHRPKRPGESALLVAEELRFHRRIWQRSAIYSDERAVAAPVLLMDIARDLFLAGIGFPHRWQAIAVSMMLFCNVWTNNL
jgi:hypothetical protein